MKKLILLSLKLLPLLTIIQGVSSGGARLNPYVDTLKVALTQYEIAQIIKLVFDDFEKTNGPVITPAEFPGFVRDTYHSQYSVLARELSGLDSGDQSVDIWGRPFQLFLNADVTVVKVSSSGPDRKMNNKDDVSADFTIERPAPMLRKTLAQAEEETDAEDPEPAPEDREPASVAAAEDAGEYDEEGYDRDGFNRDGYDRDGYDQSGMHRSEKEVHLSASAEQE